MTRRSLSNIKNVPLSKIWSIRQARNDDMVGKSNSLTGCAAGRERDFRRIR